MPRSLVNDILTYDQLHDLWGAGYTIVKRNSDPFEIDPKLIPRGMSYQWNPLKPDHAVEVAADGDWKPVPFSRHPGVFAPWGMSGFIYRDGLGLFEKPTVVVDFHREAAKAAATKLVDDWAAQAKADGLVGHIKVGDERLEVSDVAISEGGDMAQVGATKTIETIVAIPKDMAPHIAAIFKERDRLEAEVVRKDRTLAPGPIADKFYAEVQANKAAPWWPTLRAILLPIAVDNVRASLKKESTDE